MPTELSLTIGIGLLIATTILVLRQLSFGSRMLKAKATVVKIRKEKGFDFDDPDMYFPIIEFKDINDRDINFECWGSSSKHGLFEGKEVEVIYDPLKPNKAIINVWWRRWLILISCAFFGCAFTFFSIKNLIHGI